jgi:pimeloyl-ACP methyl ester carboxylesterase
MLLKTNCLKLPVILVFLTYYACPGQLSSLTIHEAYGTFGVGFQVNHTFDYSRSFATKDSSGLLSSEEYGFRPMQVCIWYPALENEESTPMHYEEYFFLSASETGSIALNTSKKEEIMKNFIKTEPVNSAKLNSELGVEMSAVKDALPDLSGRFPIIIYGPSWSSAAFENALLCEFLASHGYVVVASPSVGPDNRDMPISLIGVETQARDMEFLLQEIRKFPNADVESIAVAGFSLGGLSNVLMLARNKLVDAWIGIDPSIHEAYGIFKESPYEDYGRFSVPALFINSYGYMHEMPFFDQLVYSDAYVVNLPKLHHSDMASQFIKLYSEETKESLGVRENGYNIMAKYFLGFVDGIFKEKRDYPGMANGVFGQRNLDSAFIKINSKKGILLPAQLFEKYESRQGRGIVEYLDTLLRSEEQRVYPEADIQKIVYRCIKNDFEDATVALMNWYQTQYPNAFPKQVLEFLNIKDMARMFAKLYEDNNSCNFTYRELNHTAQMLSMGDSKDEAMEYFILNTNLYPDNYQAFFNLGIGYFRINELGHAKMNFEKCLTLNPDDRFRGLAREFIEKTQL